MGYFLSFFSANCRRYPIAHARWFSNRGFKGCCCDLKEPLANPLYFVGEAPYEGQAMGTVEAALANRKQVAEKIIAEAGEYAWKLLF